MKAAYIKAHGVPEVFEYGELPDPVARAGEVVIDIHAASVNAADWNDVIAVRLTFTTRSSSNAGVNQQPIERTFINLVSLRNQEVVQ